MDTILEGLNIEELLQNILEQDKDAISIRDLIMNIVQKKVNQKSTSLLGNGIHILLTKIICNSSSQETEYVRIATKLLEKSLPKSTPLSKLLIWLKIEGYIDTMNPYIIEWYNENPIIKGILAQSTFMPAIQLDIVESIVLCEFEGNAMSFHELMKGRIGSRAFTDTDRVQIVTYLYINSLSEDLVNEAEIWLKDWSVRAGGLARTLNLTEELTKI